MLVLSLGHLVACVNECFGHFLHSLIENIQSSIDEGFPKNTMSHIRCYTWGVFTCLILASIVTILVSIVMILTSIEPILEKCFHLQMQYLRVLSQHL